MSSSNTKLHSTKKFEQVRNNFYFQIDTLGSGFIYYWDWGPNSGSNWLISSNSDGTNRGIESDNVESGATNYTTCLNQVNLHIQERFISFHSQWSVEFIQRFFVFENHNQTKSQ
jgi:hypothetical protein